jgi:diketogulonate reductase-like aldo/keto reductase
MDTWLTFEKLYGDGTGNLRGIGVSNFSVDELKELISDERTKIKPMVNQVEFSPFLYQKELLEYCKEQKIVLTAYTPLVATKKKDNPVVVEVA